VTAGGSAHTRAGAGAETARSRKRAALVWVARVVVVGVVFLVGLVIGRAIEDAPRPGGEQTIVRTLEPSTLGPVETVTVTAP
jgi:hypothetical protein